SVDHSVVQELVESGEIEPDEARGHPERHVITRAVGTGADPDPDYWLIPAAPSDRMLICSDGLTSEVDDRTLRELLATDPDPQNAAGRRSDPDPQNVAQRLITTALAAGGRDNVSAIVVDLA